MIVNAMNEMLQYTSIYHQGDQPAEISTFQEQLSHSFTFQKLAANQKFNSSKGENSVPRYETSNFRTKALGFRERSQVNILIGWLPVTVYTQVPIP